MILIGFREASRLGSLAVRLTGTGVLTGAVTVHVIYSVCKAASSLKSTGENISFSTTHSR
ncbi:hypothetical protein EYF80_054900 [Liparis tanakae]|uniref:Uncharacterized protein n=1 Tax=Liparis tanakae TaxID=230148 RepID=A0A4Z2F2D7_9TELE|nr:hypothetical protein EYF80_054900 [Liparis tanakae]